MRLTFVLYNADGGKSVHAAQITEHNLEHVETVWTPDKQIRIGDYVILMGNGNLEVVRKTRFTDTFYQVSPKVEVLA